jgi:hypothetical protein
MKNCHGKATLGATSAVNFSCVASTLLGSIGPGETSLFERQGRVCPSMARGIGKGNLHLLILGVMRHVIKVTLGTGMFVAHCGWQNAISGRIPTSASAIWMLRTTHALRGRAWPYGRPFRLSRNR